MSLVESVKSYSYGTRDEWIAELHRLGDRAETTRRALKNAKSDRQIGQREQARADEDLAGQALSWFQYGTWPMPTLKGFEEIANHITLSMAKATS